MFNIRKKNKYNALLAYLITNFLTQEVFNRLKKERSEFWGFLKYETIETLKREKFRWNKKSLIIAIQDFLDVHAGRVSNILHGKKEIRKDPYIFEVLKLLKIKYDPNQRREELERIINEKIEKLGIPAKG